MSYDWKTSSDWHTTHLYTCLTSYEDSQKYFERYPQAAQKNVTFLVSMFVSGTPYSRYQQAISSFLQGSILAETKDIRRWNVKERSEKLTKWEQLALDCYLQDKGDEVIRVIPYWADSAIVRRGQSDLNTYCQGAVKLIMAEIDFEKLESQLRGK